MKNFTKLICIIAIVAVIGFSFVACGGDNGGSGDNGGGAGVNLENSSYIYNYIRFEKKYGGIGGKEAFETIFAPLKAQTEFEKNRVTAYTKEELTAKYNAAKAADADPNNDTVVVGYELPKTYNELMSYHLNGKYLDTQPAVKEALKIKGACVIDTTISYDGNDVNVLVIIRK
jgi:hypothetical protein